MLFRGKIKVASGEFSGWVLRNVHRDALPWLNENVNGRDTESTLFMRELNLDINEI